RRYDAAIENAKNDWRDQTSVLDKALDVAIESIYATYLEELEAVYKAEASRTRQAAINAKILQVQKAGKPAMETKASLHKLIKDRENEISRLRDQIPIAAVRHHTGYVVVFLPNGKILGKKADVKWELNGQVISVSDVHGPNAGKVTTTYTFEPNGVNFKGL